MWVYLYVNTYVYIHTFIHTHFYIPCIWYGILKHYYIFVAYPLLTIVNIHKMFTSCRTFTVRVIKWNVLHNRQCNNMNVKKGSLHTYFKFIRIVFTMVDCWLFANVTASNDWIFVRSNLMCHLCFKTFRIKKWAAELFPHYDNELLILVLSVSSLRFDTASNIYAVLISVQRII